VRDVVIIVGSHLLYKLIFIVSLLFGLGRWSVCLCWCAGGRGGIEGSDERRVQNNINMSNTNNLFNSTSKALLPRCLQTKP
jgi:hypothetical protein